MPTTKRILCPERLRRVPKAFSWIDHRLVRDGHISLPHSQRARRVSPMARHLFPRLAGAGGVRVSTHIQSPE
jgi:hypothetical protein